jgi:hypothetical protein
MTPNCDELLLTIQARGWRLHSLYSYPDDKLGLLRWGASIKLTVHRYGFSIAKLSAIEALESAIADATAKQQEDWRPTLQDLSLAPPPRPKAPSLDDIFGAL